MTSGLLDLEIEDYSPRPPQGAPGPSRENATTSIWTLLLLTLFFAGFVSVAVILSTAAGAC